MASDHFSLVRAHSAQVQPSFSLQRFQSYRMKGKVVPCAGTEGGKRRAGKPSLRESFVFLTQSRQIRCLAVMALAQGLSTNLIEIAWKSHLHMLHPSPAAYSVSTRLPSMPWLTVSLTLGTILLGFQLIRHLFKLV